MAKIDVYPTIEDLIDRLEEIIDRHSISGVILAPLRAYGGCEARLEVAYTDDDLVDHASTQTLECALGERLDYEPDQDEFDKGELIELAAAIRRGDRIASEQALDRVFAPYAHASEAIAQGRFSRMARRAA